MNSNRVAGGHPTANLGGEAFRSKFTVAHEYGHLKTLLDPIPTFSSSDLDFCYSKPSNCTLTWVPESPEWQSVAAVEGFADFHAMLVWNDLQGTPRDAVKSWAVTQNSWRCRYRPDPIAQGDIDVPDDCEPDNDDLDVTVIADSWHYQQNCDPEDCVLGVATASDWAWALWDMRLFTDVPTAGLLSMLGFAHSWTVNGENSDYWDHFVQSVAGPVLSGDDLTTWIGVSEIRGIDD